MDMSVARVRSPTVAVVEVVPGGTTARDYIAFKVDTDDREDKDDAFYVCDLGRLVELYGRWMAALPRVHPFYAVKCNSEPALLATLAALGAGFDCSSKREIKMVLDLGVPADRIIYAHPCKQVSHLQFAAARGVRLMTFDNEPELHKVKSHSPNARLVLRVRSDDPTALFPLGEKFGCSVHAGKGLLTTASNLGLSVVGVSFHVGCYAQSADSFGVAMENAAKIFQHAESIGYYMTLLDIGGGFPGFYQPRDDKLFADMTAVINQGIDVHFSSFGDLTIISEPGRFFACSTQTVALNVIAKHTTCLTPSSEDTSATYFVNEGVYGTLRYFNDTPRVLQVLKPPLPSAQLYTSKIWGHTCASGDKLCDSVMLPELAVGEWLFAEGMGDYTGCVYSEFNAFPRPKTYYYVTGANSERLCQLFETHKKLEFILTKVEPMSVTVD